MTTTEGAKGVGLLETRISEIEVTLGVQGQAIEGIVGQLKQQGAQLTAIQDSLSKRPGTNWGWVLGGCSLVVLLVVSIVGGIGQGYVNVVGVNTSRIQSTEDAVVVLREFKAATLERIRSLEAKAYGVVIVPPLRDERR
jgi:hypothetical protein